MSDGLRLLHAILAESSLATFSRLDPEIFNPDERPVYDFIQEHRRSHRALPQAQTVSEEIGTRFPRAPEPLSYYVEQVYERHEYNQIHARWGSMRDAMQTRNMELVRENVRAMSVATRAGGNRQGREVMDLRQAGQLVTTRLRDTRGMGGITGIETNWPRFDMETGGFQNSDLVSLIARPGMGKTYALLKMAHQAHLVGHNVLVVTTEMGIEQLTRRHTSIALGINPTLLKRNMISTYTERRIATFYSDMAGAENFRVFSVGMNSRVNAIEAFCQEFGPSIVFIDGGYLLRPTEAPKNANRIERITGVFDELKGLTLEADIPFVVTSQFNRQAGKGGKEGSLETVGYTDAIGTHSSIVVALKTGPTENPFASRYLEFLKGREGESGEIAINFKFAPLNMEEMSEEEQESASDSPAPAGGAATDWMA